MTTKNRDASSTRETIARAFLTSFPNFERVARANGDAVDEDVRDLAHLADSDRLRRARAARPRRHARRNRDKSRMRRVAARSRAREGRARRARRVRGVRAATLCVSYGRASRIQRISTL